MDDIVRQAMAKWPNVPDCYGWLGLDCRGHWYMRDDAAQVSGSFASGFPGAKGSLLRHEKLIEFIHRNYACDAKGQWFFQNGPQRVFVELEATPWIWRISENKVIQAQTGANTSYRQAWVDARGHVYLETDLGIGLVHTLDVEQVADALEAGLWTVMDIEQSALAKSFGFVPSPFAMHEELTSGNYFKPKHQSDDKPNGGP